MLFSVIGEEAPESGSGGTARSNRRRVLAIVWSFVLVTSAVSVGVGVSGAAGADAGTGPLPPGADSTTAIDATTTTAQHTADQLPVTVRQVNRPDFPEVSVYTSVRSPDGQPITGLTANDFEVTEDGTDQTIESVEQVDTTATDISVSLVMDGSGSMRGSKLRESKAAAKEFVSQFGPGDEGQVISFAQTVEREQRWTTDSAALAAAIDGISTDDYTALWEATRVGVDDASSRVGRSAVIVLTDGKNTEPPGSADAPIARARETGVPVYTIGLGSDVNDAALRRLAEETGGDYYRSPTASELSDIYSQIRQSITAEYRVTYRTTNTATDGTQRTVEVRTSTGGAVGSDTGTYQAPCAPLPGAAFQYGPRSPETGQTVSFDASSSSANGGSIATYRWDFDNDGVVDATGPQPTHTYPDAGTYEAKLTVEKACGASDVMIRQVTVSASNQLPVTARQVTRSEFPEITIYTSVEDADGTPISGLTASDLEVTEDGTQQTIQSVEPVTTAGGSGASVSLVLDRSGSMDGQKIDDSKEAASEFVSQFGSDDEGIVIAFDDQVEYKTRWTSQTASLTAAIDDISTGGNTALWRATQVGVDEAESRVGRSAVIVLTDGKNNEAPTNVEAAIDRAQTAGVPVYTIGLGSGVNERELRRLASETGGTYYRSPTSAELSQIYNQIQQSITTEYRVTYRTSNTATDGAERTVRLTASNGSAVGFDTGTYEAPCAPLPDAAFSYWNNPGTPGEGESVPFDASSSSGNGGQIVEYRWDFDNDGVVDATGRNVDHTYQSPGTYEAKLTVEKACGATDSVVKEIVVQALPSSIETQRPFGGSPAQLPTRIDASHFDTGGGGVSYNDSSGERLDDSGFRPGVGVDIESPSLGGTGDGSIGYVEEGEWTEYTVQADPGTYTLSLTVASDLDGQLRATIDGKEIGTITRDTEGWYNFKETEVGQFTVDQAGEHVIRIESVGPPLNYDSLVFEEGGTTSSQEPYYGTSRSIPGRIEAENFDEGGEGVAYNDVDAENRGGEYRNTAVDIERAQDSDGSYSVSWTRDGEWLEYTVDAEPGTYDISFRITSPRGGNALDVSLGGTDIGTVDVPNTGGYYEWTTVTLRDVEITASGEQVLRIDVRGSRVNINWIEFDRDSTTAQSPYRGTAPNPPSEIDASHFDTGGEGVAYHDTTSDRLDSSGFRPDASVDIESPSKGGSGDGSIGYVEQGEWVEYTIDADPGTYTLSLAVASDRDGQVRVTVDGREVGTVTRDTDGWYDFRETEVGEFTVSQAGEHVIRVEWVGEPLNLDRLHVE